MIKKDKINSGKQKNRKKSRNKIIQILAKSKSRNLPRFKFKNLTRSKKV